MILLINTAAPEGFVALVRGSLVIATISFRRQFGATDPLLPGIEAVFKKAKSNIKNLKAIAVVTGPGSFAGLRTGISAANAIAWARSISVVGVPTSAATTPEDMAKFVGSKKTTVKTRSVMPRYGRKPNISKKAVN